MRSARSGAELVGQLGQEGADVGDDAVGLVAAAVAELGDDRRVDVDAVGLDRGGQHVAGGDGVQGGGQHQRHPHPGDQLAHAIGHLDDVSHGVGQRTVVAHRPAEDEGHAGLHAGVHDPVGEVAGLHRGGDGAVAADLVDDPEVVAVAALGPGAGADRDAEGRAQHRRLDVVGGEAVAGEEDLDPPGPHQAGHRRPAAGVDDGRPAHGEHRCVVLPCRPEAVGEGPELERLGLLGGHVGVHEHEAGPTPGRAGGEDAHAVGPDDHGVPGPEAVEGDGAHDRVRPGGPVARIRVDDEDAVHLGPVRGDPAAGDPDLGDEVGRGAEPGGGHPVGRRRLRGRVAGRGRVGPLHLEQLGQGGEGGVVGRGDLDHGAAGVGGRAPDVHVEQLVVAARLEHQVEHLGQDEGVDDVPLERERLDGGHWESLDPPRVDCRAMGQPVVVVEKPSVANPGMVRFETNRALTGMGHERYLPSVEVRGDRPPDEIARRLLARGGIEAIHINGSVVTVDLAKGATTDGLREIIENLFIHYPATPVADAAPADADQPATEGELEAEIAEAAPAAPAPEHEPAVPAAEAAAEELDAAAAETATPPVAPSADAVADADEVTDSDVQQVEGDAPTVDQAPAGGSPSDPPVDEPTAAEAPAPSPEDAPAESDAPAEEPAEDASAEDAPAAEEAPSEAPPAEDPAPSA